MNIAITGEGIISAIGTNKEEVLQSLLAHKSGIKEMQFLQSVHHELPVGEVALSNEQMKKRLGIPEKQLMSRTELMGILAIRQALEDAGIDLSAVSASNKKIVLVSGTTVGGMDLTEQSFSHSRKQKWKNWLFSTTTMEATAHRRLLIISEMNRQQDKVDLMN